MTNKIKEFIEKNIEFIEENKWEEIYQKATNELDAYTGKFTEVMLDADIHPESYLKELPKNFCRESNIKNFTIPDHIKSISDRVFYRCKRLTSVTIPDDVTSIGKYTFSWCDSLTSVIIPNNVTNIDDWMFYGCKSLTDVTIGNGVNSIGNGMFYNCYNLTGVTISNSVTSIGYDAFYGCQDLNIIYTGTTAEWKTIAKGKFSGVKYTCTCIDGIVKKSR